MTDLPVLIVGAGPTGLTLACELARAGVPLRIVEAEAGPRPGSRGKGVQPRTLEVFDDLGVGERVRAHGRLGLPMRSTGPDGRATTTGGDPVRPRPGIPYGTSLITPEWRVEEALRLRLAELGGAVEFGSRLRGFAQTPEAVTATVVRAGAPETIAARWLVGCDGGHSVVRKGAGIAFAGETREDVRMLVADVAVDGLDRAAWHVWQHAEGLVGLCPLPSTGLFQYQAGLAPGRSPALDRASLQAVLERRTGRTDLRLHEPVWSSLWRANVRLADRYRVGRVLIAGDAAHVHSPAGGQGMNTGIQDAHNLAWKLAPVAGGAAPGLLDTYEAERRPVAQGVLALSDERLRRAVATNTIPAGRDATTMQLAIGYRGSPLARDDRSPQAPLRAGDRAPDATALRTPGGVHRLFDLIGGGRFTLLAFGAAPDGPAAVRTLRIGPGGVEDTEGHLAAAYAPSGRSLVLIRPDGHIGLISDAGDASAVTDYLAAVAAAR